MPNHEAHCEDSLRRYGKTFSELHKWMDEPSAILGASHRKYRHDPNTTPREAKAIFGESADHACLDHIRLDELESRRQGIRRDTSVSTDPYALPFISGLCSLVFFLIGVFTTEGIGFSVFCYMIALVSFMGFIWSLIAKGSSDIELRKAKAELQESKDKLKKAIAEYEGKYGADYEISPFDTPEVKIAKERLKKIKAEYEAKYGSLPKSWKTAMFGEQKLIRCPKCRATYFSIHEKCPFCGEPQPKT
jgi:hypothetical protein